VRFLLHVRHASGDVETIPFATAYDRALWMIFLASAPVVLRIENVG
jgi:hypothetical protein